MHQQRQGRKRLQIGKYACKQCRMLSKIFMRKEVYSIHLLDLGDTRCVYVNIEYKFTRKLHVVYC